MQSNSISKIKDMIFNTSKGMQSDLSKFKERMNNQRESVEQAVSRAADSKEPCCDSCGDHGPCESESQTPRFSAERVVDDELPEFELPEFGSSGLDNNYTDLNFEIYNEDQGQDQQYRDLFIQLGDSEPILSDMNFIRINDQDQAGEESEPCCSGCGDGGSCDGDGEERNVELPTLDQTEELNLERPTVEFTERELNLEEPLGTPQKTLKELSFFN